MTNDSLLRLFKSEFFNAWIAVSYMYKYYYNDDIIHYLCDALKTLPSTEIEYFLPQLLHLMISKPTLTVTLEDTLVDLWKRYPHFAVMSIWHLRTYLSDWSSEPTSPSYLLCQRAISKCQTCLRMESMTHYELHKDGLDRTTVAQHRHSRESSSAKAKMEFDQQLWEEKNSHYAGTQRQHDKDIRNSNNGMLRMEISNGSVNDSSIHDTAPSSLSPQQPSPQSHHDIRNDSHMTNCSTHHHAPFGVSLKALHGGGAFSLSRYLPNHMKSLHQHKPFQSMRRAVSSYGVMANELDYKKTNVMGLSAVPFSNSNTTSVNSTENDQLPSISSPRSNHLRHSLSASYLSTFYTQRGQHGDICDYYLHHPSLPLLEPSSSSSTSSPFPSPRPCSPISNISSISNNNDNSMKINPFYGDQWTCSGYYQREMQFLDTLAGIAERLVALPKLSRGSALHAELTLLNHHLPADICLPLWCLGSDSSLHHRVVRVSPSDAVVLNSAERAPYLLFIEVLEGDLCLEFQRTKLNGGNGSEQEGTDKTAAMVDLMALSPKTTSDTMAMDTHPTSTEFSQEMQTAAVLLAQLQQQQQYANDPAQMMVHAIRQRVIDQMAVLEEQQRIQSASTSTKRYETTKQLLINTHRIKKGRGSDGNSSVDDKRKSAASESTRTMVENKDDPSAAILSEAWQVKMTRIRKNSPFGHLPNWRLLSVIVKQGADLRQEQFALQLIREMQKIWQDAGVNAWVKYYQVLVTSENSGLIETIRNTVSIHSIKKNAHAKKQADSGYILRDFFKQRWGTPKSTKFKAAQVAFLKSLAGYSIACYLLQIKDRHNGNLLLDDQGHLIHIDFGFILSNSPGSMGFEKAPFKLSQEYIDVLGGMDSELFDQYRYLMKQSFKALRKYGDTILLLVDMMGKTSNLPCFKNNPDQVLSQLKERFQFHLTDQQLDMFVDNLISSSCGNLFTRLYDTYQYYSQGIL